MAAAPTFTAVELSEWLPTAGSPQRLFNCLHLPCTHVCSICCHTRAATVRRMLQSRDESINVSVAHSVNASLAHEVYSKISYNNGFATKTIYYFTVAAQTAIFTFRLTRRTSAVSLSMTLSIRPISSPCISMVYTTIGKCSNAYQFMQHCVPIFWIINIFIIT